MRDDAVVRIKRRGRMRERKNYAINFEIAQNANPRAMKMEFVDLKLKFYATHESIERLSIRTHPDFLNKQASRTSNVSLCAPLFTPFSDNELLELSILVGFIFRGDDVDADNDEKQPLSY